jgi:hypothetical protein
VYGFGRGQVIDLRVEDDRFALQELTLEAGKPGQKEFAQSLAAPQKFEGEVVAADSGKPVPKVWVSVLSFRNFATTRQTGGWADARGRFRINPYPGTSFWVRFHVRSAAPYLGVERRIEWPKEGAPKYKLRIKLPRGVLIRGKVLEKKSGKPVNWVRVYFQPQQENNPKLPRDLLAPRYWPAVSAPDGSFQLVVPGGPGLLLARIAEAPGLKGLPFGDGVGAASISNPPSVLRPWSKDFIWSSVSAEQLRSGSSGGQRSYFHAIVLLNLKPQPGPKKLIVSLRRGVTLKGQLVGPDGKAVPEAVLFGPGDLIPPDQPLSAFFRGSSPRAVVLKDGKFELPGCDPDKTYRVFLLGFPRRTKLLPAGPELGHIFAQLLPQMIGKTQGCLGAAVELSAKKAAGKPLTVKLAPCGSATVRLVDKEGKPVKVSAVVELVVNPRQGPAKFAVFEEVVPVATPNGGGLGMIGQGILVPVGGGMARNPLKLPGLIPGATYRIRVFGGRFNLLAEKEFTVKTGQALRLKDLVIKGPN